MKPIILTEFVIRYDVRLKGWIAFKIERTAGRKSEIQNRTAMTSPKLAPRLAARALARALTEAEFS